MKISNHLFHIVVQPVRDLLCWQWFLILCKLPLFTFPPSSPESNLYVLNSKSRDCGSIRPIQPETMDAASSMVWWVVKYRVGWLSAHCSYHYTRFNGRWSHHRRGSFISVWNSKQLFHFEAYVPEQTTLFSLQNLEQVSTFHPTCTSRPLSLFSLNYLFSSPFWKDTWTLY